MLNAVDVNKAFGETLRTLRDRSGVSQTELASRSGLGRTTIANMELGGQAATVFQLYVLAHALGAEPAELLPDIAHAWASDDAARLIRNREAILNSF